MVAEVASSCRVAGRREEGEGGRSQFFVRIVLLERKSGGWLGKNFSIITKHGLVSQRVFEKLVASSSCVENQAQDGGSENRPKNRLR